MAVAIVAYIFIYCWICPQHLATMAVEGKLNKISPVESVRKLKSVLEQRHVWKHNVFLVITDTEIIIKDVSTKVHSHCTIIMMFTYTLLPWDWV